jgi:hypothetical protein
MDTATANGFNVHISEGHVIKFSLIRPGLYLLDTTNVDIHKLRQSFSFLNTVDQNKKHFGKREVRKADEALLLNRKSNHVAKDKFLRIVKNNLICNNPVTIGDVKRSQAIYGPPIPPLKGRIRYQESPRIKDLDTIQLPKALHEDLKDVTLCIDFHYVNGVTVFHTISRKIGYRTVSFPLSRSKSVILEELKNVFKIYNARGFKVTDIHADVEFDKIKIAILPVRLITCGVDDHVPEIERSVQTQKNENRSVCYAMPYKCFPRLMVREIIKQGNEFLNAFGTENNNASGLTPRNIIDNLPHIDYNDLKYEFGQYVQLHITEKVTNTMKTRTIGAIVLGPGNIRGKYNFMSLETGMQINGRVVAILPITNEVMERVEALGQEQQQPFRVSKMLKYEWRPGTALDNDDENIRIEDEAVDEGIIPAQIAQDIPHAGPNPLNIETPLEQIVNQGVEVHGVQDDEQIFEDQGVEDQGVGIAIEDLNETFEMEEGMSTEEEETDESDDDEDREIDERRNKEKERRAAHFNIDNEAQGRGKRNRQKPSNFSFMQTQFKDLPKEEKDNYLMQAWKEYKSGGKTALLERYTTGFIFNQLSAKKGIEKYGREAEMTLINEFKQLLEYETFHGCNANELSYEQKKKAANMISIIEEKVNRGHTDENPVIKGRSVFNGRVQRGIYSKEETASPTVSQDSFYLTSIVDAIENRDKAFTDIKGAYLNAKMKDDVHMKIVGKEVELFCEIDPTLAQYVTIEKGKKILYVKLDKALYGCVQSALLWYELYSNTLKDMGFELNPYDLCVANANIDGKQCTILWYVDDNKISHADPKVVDKVIKKIESKFGKMSQTRGDKHDFLGMNIHFKKNKIKISMKKHILKAMETFDEDITRNAATPATSYLFQVRDSPNLSEARADNFHSVTAALLFISRRCRLDIQTAVGFLTTRVSCPTEDDWAKLRRVLQYLRGTIDLFLTLGGDDITKMKTWVDVSYGVHDDCRSHTGGAISFGWGVLLTKCQKQKLNTKSSTEAEIVGVSDYLPNMIWARMFLGEQGFILKENILYQDNQSAIKIEKNGKRSSGQKTKHMDNRYFFIKDRLNTENIRVEYCPTGQMIADFFTKPLQGNLFRKLRDLVLGYKHISEANDMFQNSEKSPLQECIENNITTGNIKGDVGGDEVKSLNINVPPKKVSWADVVIGKQ